MSEHFSHGKDFTPDRYNLSAWALRHQSMVLYLMIVLTLAGIFSYFKLGRAEDPDFTFKVMVVRTLWPGATAQEVEQQVTERIEKKLQETPWVDVIHSASRPNESLIFITLKDYTPKKEVPEAWYQVRKRIGDNKGLLPAGVQGPFMNDDFGDTQISIYALTGDGIALPELRRQADRLARDIYRLGDIKKVEMLGVQDEKIYLEFSQTKLKNLGLSPDAVTTALERLNTLVPSGYFDTATDRVYVNIPSDAANLENLRNLTLPLANRSVRLGDVATLRRAVSDPPTPRMRVNGQDAVGLGIVMSKGGDVIHLGERLEATVRQFENDLPRGIDIHQVANQPEVVRDSLNLFLKSLFEALGIVLAVSFLSLGLRTGTVVALSIPLVLALTFLAMSLFGIDLQRISLGALVIALGLLVDDAIIAVEMMVVKMEEGWDRFQAATFAYASTSFPMLTGTLITAAGFTPVGFAKSAAGEYTFDIFAVVTIALCVSWIVAVFFTPYLGYHLLSPEKLKAEGAKHHGDIYNTPFYQRVRQVVSWCVEHRRIVISSTVVAFILAIVAFNTLVQKQFFPASSRPELLVDVWLPQTASLKATTQLSQKIEAILEKDEDVGMFATYIGAGSPRFYLPLDQQLNNDNYAQFVVTAKDLVAREHLKTKLEATFASADGQWSSARVRVLRLENGPPVGFPVAFRVSGENLTTLRNIAEEVAQVMRANPHLKDVNFDWHEQIKRVRLELDQDKINRLGIASQDVATFLNTLQQGRVVTQVREGDQLIDIVARATMDEREDLAQLLNFNIHVGGGRYVPLSQIAHAHYELDEGIIWRRNRLPTITVRADLLDQRTQAPTVSMQVNPLLEPIRAKLPPGYRIEMGGSVEESAKGEKPIMAMMPIMLLLVTTLLMIQLQSFRRSVMVLLTAPLGLIGVAISLVLFQAPFGFVANLGVIALFGMIMRNSVILVDQIEQDQKAGKTPWEAIVGSAVRRARPILLTAAAAILAMIPLSRQVFWGPMAVAIMGGLLVATVLTLLFLPALYAAWYRVQPPGKPAL